MNLRVLTGAGIIAVGYVAFIYGKLVILGGIRRMVKYEKYAIGFAGDTLDFESFKKVIKVLENESKSALAGMKEEFRQERLKYLNSDSEGYRKCIAFYVYKQENLIKHTIKRELLKFGVSSEIFEKSIEKYHKNREFLEVLKGEMAMDTQLPENLTKEVYLEILMKKEELYSKVISQYKDSFIPPLLFLEIEFCIADEILASHGIDPGSLSVGYLAYSKYKEVKALVIRISALKSDLMPGVRLAKF